MHSRRAVGSLIGIGFLLMIITLGLSYYNTINMIESSSNNIFLEISDLDKKAVDEVLEIQSVKLTVTNSLNLTIKNTGSVLSSLKWIGVFDDSLNTQEYYSVDTSLNPAETQIDIGNSSITINPSNTYTIQVLTKLGNMYYGEYPEPSTGGGSGGETGPVYSDYETTDLHANTTIGTHSLFGAMKAGPDEFLNTLTEGSEDTWADGVINDTIIDSLEFNITKGKTPTMVHVSGDVYAIAYSGDGDVGRLITVTISDAGAITDTVIDSLLFDAVKGKTPDIVHVSGTTYAIAYSGNGDVGMLITVTISDAGAITDTIIDSLQFMSTKGKEPNIQHISGNVYAVAYQDDQGGGNPKPGVINTVEILADGSIGAAVIDSLEFDTVQGKSPSIIQVSGDVYTIAYSGDTDDGTLVSIRFFKGIVDNYLLDLEVKWSDLSGYNNEYLRVYGEAQGSEVLQVDVWDGVQWVTVIGDIQTGWNTVDVSAYLTGSSFSIRFKDTVMTSDATQDSWEIDALVLNLFD